jgi:hypothetical protein
MIAGFMDAHLPNINWSLEQEANSSPRAEISLRHIQTYKENPNTCALFLIQFIFTLASPHRF